MKNTERYIPFIIFAVAVGFFVRPLFSGMAVSGHDAGYHYVQLQLFEKALKEGQWPVRWIEVPHLNLTFPQFEFYPTLFYYPGAILMRMGFDFADAVSLTILLSAGMGWIFMYLLVRQSLGEGGSRAGVAAAALFLFTPYRISQVYVRGAWGEFLATSAIPLIFLGALMIFENRKAGSVRRGIIWEAIGFFIIATSHQLTLFMAAVPLAIWIVFLKLKFSRDIKSIILSIAGLTGGFGLSAFFLLPQLFEKDFTQYQRIFSGYFDFHLHFAGLSKLFFSPWGYGPSGPGVNSPMSLQLGLVNWMVLVGAGTWLLSKLLRVPKLLRLEETIIIFYTGLALLSLFMTTVYSRAVWESLPFLSYIQFPWRFLSLASFSTAVLSGLLFLLWEKKAGKNKNYVKYIYWGILLISVISNLQYLKPERYFPKESLNLNSPNTLTQIASDAKVLSIGRLPVWVQKLEPGILDSRITVLNGVATISGLIDKTAYKKFQAEVSKNSVIRTESSYFPGWTAEIDDGKNKKTVIPNHQNPEGAMDLSLEKGRYNITLAFNKTPIREIGDMISLISWAMVLGGILVLIKSSINQGNK